MGLSTREPPGAEKGSLTHGRGNRPKLALFSQAYKHPASERMFVNVEFTVEYHTHMQTIQIVLDEKLLKAADRAARKTKRNRSALMRDALREHLRRLEVRSLEERDREGYSRRPQTEAETRVWELEAAWPEE